ncbi:MAG: gamma-glutamyl-gamma-aminobutyrate hydrolase family protein [Reyranellaceae bacterium]
MSTAKATSLPLVGLPACVKQLNNSPFHTVQEKYLTAVRQAAGCAPLILPAFGWQRDGDTGPGLGLGLALDPLLDMLDGVLLTGSPSNVEPHHYQGQPSAPGTEHDPQRDATTLPLIRRAIERGIPLLAICRGIQELNVAMGGTLHQRVHEVPGRFDHRSRAARDRPLDERYALAHPVALAKEGWLAQRLGCTQIMVNSLHGQGIDRLAPGMAIEATADDGTVEAIRLPSASGFVLGLQWHPEYGATDNPVSLSLFQAFGDAAREHAARRRLNAAA